MEGKNDVPGWHVPNKSWRQKLGEEDITKKPVSEIQEDAKKGIRYDIKTSEPGKVIADREQIVIQGDDEP